MLIEWGWRIHPSARRTSQSPRRRLFPTWPGGAVRAVTWRDTVSL